MSDEKDDIDLDDDDIEPNPQDGGIIFVYPLFKINGSEDIFAISDMLWIMPWQPDPTKPPKELTPKLEHVAARAFELRAVGIVTTGEYFYVRDLNESFIFTTIDHPFLEEKLNIFFTSGPRYDQNVVTHKKVTIH